MNRILVTGGLGYIGSHTCVALIEAGYHPVVIDNLRNTRISVKHAIEDITGDPLECYQLDAKDAIGVVFPPKVENNQKEKIPNLVLLQPEGIQP